jgi:hypothetical protein
VAQFSNVLRQNRLVNGAGVKIGIISNSFNRDKGMAASVVKGELPGLGNPSGFYKPVQIIREASPTEWTGTRPDEGRAMAEIIHDVAPGSEIYFYSPFDGQSIAMAEAFRALAKSGCQIIVDDITGLISPFYQDDIAAVVQWGYTFFCGWQFWQRRK